GRVRRRRMGEPRRRRGRGLVGAGAGVLGLAYASPARLRLSQGRGKPIATFDVPGATANPDGSTRFLVWAPRAESVDVVLGGDPERAVPLERGEHGYFAGAVEDAPAGTRYRFRLNGDPDRI